MTFILTTPARVPSQPPAHNGDPARLDGDAPASTDGSLSGDDAMYRTLVEMAPHVIFRLSMADGCLTAANPAFETLTGWSPAESLGRPYRDFVHPDDLPIADQVFAQISRGETPAPVQLRLRSKAGHYLIGEVQARPTIEGGRVTGMIGVFQDATEQRRAEELLCRREQEFRALVEHASDIIARIARDLRLLYVNPAVEAATGRPPSDVIGRTLAELGLPPEFVRTWISHLQQVFTTGREAMVDFEYPTLDGVRHYSARLTPEFAPDGAVESVLSIARDITSYKELERQLLHQAYRDPLTDLPNRAMLLQRLDRALAGGARIGSQVAMLFLDLDNFKVINDSLGHEVGDDLLVAVARRLRDCIRPGDTIARFGGDEFVILLAPPSMVDDAVAVSERILAAFKSPFTVGGRDLFVTTSVGIALGTPNRDRPQDILRHADVALYDAKRNGRMRYGVFEPRLVTAAMERLEIENDLRRAVERRELRLYYQPVVDLMSGEVRGVEALLRWQHPIRGLMEPDSFIPVAEETGLIVPAGTWALERACRQVADWQRSRPGGRPLTLSVNLSARQFRDPSLAADVARALAKSGLDPSHLTLEMTESLMIADVEPAVTTMRQLKQLGVRFAVDDFGTGYSALAYLKHFPVDSLKIDRSFVQSLGVHREDQALVRALIAAARALRLEIIAEGIESDEQVTLLLLMGCRQGQGFLFAKPLPDDALDLILGRGPLYTNPMRTPSASSTRHTTDG